MTQPTDPGPTDVEGRELPPYEGRRQSADVAGQEKGHRDGATVGGATGPVESDERKAPDPADTPGGAVASPADEQPAHDPGTTRGEDVGDRASEDRDYGYDELGAGD
jgi:hypothetical protein